MESMIYSRRLRTPVQFPHESRAGSTDGSIPRDGGMERVDAWTPCDDIMAREGIAEDLEEVTMTREEFDQQINDARLSGQSGILRHVWMGSETLLDALKKLYVATLYGKPELLGALANMSAAAKMFGETRAATSARKIREEGFLKAAGVKGFKTGGSKSEASRPHYSEAQMGNTNRRDGRRKSA